METYSITLVALLVVLKLAKKLSELLEYLKLNSGINNVLIKV